MTDNGKILAFSHEARTNVGRGVTNLAKAVKVTLGPRGRNVLIEMKDKAPHITKDGVTVAKSISFKDKFENIGAQMVKSVASRTADVAGDGPQPLYAKVLTPNGFKLMRDICLGDEVCGTNGTRQIVLGVYPKGEKEIYKVVFSDGRNVECCEDHLFTVVTNYGSEKTLTVKQMMQSGRIKVKTGKNTKYGYYVPLTEPEFNSQNTKLDPYLVGLLLGDGSLTKGEGKGHVELSLGYKKRHVLSKIKVPDGIDLNIKNVPEKNYIRVKFSGQTSDGKYMEDLLNEIGLFDVSSQTKYIPESYLFNTIEFRKKLLQGLIDTDGQINNRSRFEFSTVSADLFYDFQQLCWSLGIQIFSNLNKIRAGGYSNTPVYRVSQLKGYKYGAKIIDIVPTGVFTEMKCIKVSNDDNLYLTDNFIVTHNTTTATVLAEAIFTHGMRLMTAGHDPMSLKRGIDKAVARSVTLLNDQARDVKTSDDIKKVATISANGDEEIGKMISDAMDQVGIDGIITLEEGKSFESVLTVSNGFEFDRGFVSAYFMTPEEVQAGRQRAVHENALVWLIDGKLNSLVQLQEMMKTLEGCATQALPLLIIAESIEDVVLHTLAHNAASGKLQCVAVKAPGFGASRREMLQDLAALTGATLRDPTLVESVTKDVEFTELGRAKRIEVSKDKTVIVGVDGREDLIKTHCEKIRANIKAASDSWERIQHEKRLAKLVGGVATISVGAPTEVAMKEKRDRIEDALAATRAAVNEGIVPGGGVALLRCFSGLKGFSAGNKEEEFGVDIVKDAIKEPMRQICQNAGESPEVIINRILRSSGSSGFDAAKLETCDMFERGIVDPTKVVRVALQNAADVASLLLTTECAIIFNGEQEEPSK